MFAACTLCSCEKPAADYRDKWEGIYQGDLHFTWGYYTSGNYGDTCYYNLSAYAIKADDSNRMYINFYKNFTILMYLNENGTFKHSNGHTSITGRFTSDSLIFRVRTGSHAYTNTFEMAARKVSGTIPDTIRQSIIDNGQTVW